MTVYIYHSGVKVITRLGNYKILKNALKRAIERKEYWKQNNIDWMYCWIGE